MTTHPTLPQVELEKEFTARKKFRRKKQVAAIPAIVSGLILAAIVIAALFPQLFATHSPTSQNIVRALQPPSWLPEGSTEHFLGTDALGRDIWSRIVHGSRISLIVSVTAVAIQGFLGLLLGLLAGYYRGRVDSIIMRLADIQLAIPLLALAITVVAVIGPGLRNLVIVLGVTGWVVYARVVRSEVLTIREREFVLAARAIGGSDRSIILKHILPNVFASFTVIATLQVALMILTESALSFLGLGIQPPAVSWGSMVAQGRNYLATHWWISLFPGVAIFLTVLSINLVGDWLRDRLDPTLNT